MERVYQPHVELIDLGVASQDTKGPPGGTFELSGLARVIGISDE